MIEIHDDAADHNEHEKRVQAMADLLEAARFAAWAFDGPVKIEVGDRIWTVGPSEWGSGQDG